jgi:L-alanine-DL-glutamate epimerase-like enolase superfamily enzyme
MGLPQGPGLGVEIDPDLVETSQANEGLRR